MTIEVISNLELQRRMVLEREQLSCATDEVLKLIEAGDSVPTINPIKIEIDLIKPVV